MTHYDFQSRHDFWAAWDVPHELVARLFAAGAAYYRAAPWRHLNEASALRAEVPGGGTWWLFVTGYSSPHGGVTMLEHEADLGLVFGGDPEAAVEQARGAVLNVSFEPRSGVPRAALATIRAQGWEVADALAYPRLSLLNAAEGPRLQRQLEDLVALLEAIPRFADTHAHQTELGYLLSQPQWRDEQSGILLEAIGDRFLEGEPSDEEVDTPGDLSDWWALVDHQREAVSARGSMREDYPPLFDAYRFDLRRDPGLEHHEGATVWLLVGHCLQRVARASSEDWPLIVGHVADAFRPQPARDGAPAWPGVPVLADAMTLAGEGGTVDPAFEQGLAIVADAAAAGATWTAGAIVLALRQAFPNASHALHARAIARQAEVAQRLGFRGEASRLRLEAEIVAEL